MPLFELRLALRNLIRYRARTLIALSAISFGIIALILAGGFIEWIFWSFRESIIHSKTGHIQAVRPGYFESGRSDPFSYLLSTEPPSVGNLSSGPEIKAVAAKLNFNGLISFKDTTIAFIGEGTDVEQEKGAAHLLHIDSGAPLSANNAKEIMLGKGLAEYLGARIGDTVVLLGSTAAGGVNAVEAKVRGVFITENKAYDDSALRVPIPLAREFLRVKGAHAWVIYLSETRSTERVLKNLKQRYHGANLEFVPWYQLADFYIKTVELFSRQLNVVRLVIAVIIVLSISNTLIMSVLERTGEIGTLMALGQKRRDILRLFLSEGLLLGILGGVLGLAIGLILAYILSVVGIPMPPAPGMSTGFSAGIVVTPGLALGALALAIGTTALASVYPAFKASRMEIVDALRHNR